MSSPADSLRDQLQTTLGATYALERELGGGGMSRVFVAEEARFQRRVVIKVLSPTLAAGLSAERFEREIALAAGLQHANVVPVLAAGEVDGLPWYTMPYVDGETLRARLDSLLVFAYFNYAESFLLLGQPDSTLALLATALRLDPTGQLAVVSPIRAAALVAKGERAAAARLVADVDARAERGDVPAYAAALAHVGVGDREAALRWLARSIDRREAITATYAVSCEPMFDVLKSDPRFGALMQRMRVRVCPPA